MRTKHGQCGFAAVLMLVLLVLLLSALLAVHLEVRLSASRAAAMKTQQRIRRELQNEVAGTFAETLGLHITSGQNSSAARTSLLVLQEQFPALIEAKSTLEEKPGLHAATVVFSLLRFPGRPFELPDWRFMMEQRADYACNSWLRDTAVSGSLYRSAYTCYSLRDSAYSLGDSGITTIVIPGNLTLESPLQLTRRNGGQMYLVVKGAATFSQGLTFADLKDVTIHLIASGSVSISAIYSRNVNNTRLLVHSSGSGIIIVAELGGFSLCEGEETAGAVLLQLAAREQIQTGSRKWQGPGVKGCSWAKDARIWPGLKPMGELR